MTFNKNVTDVIEMDKYKWMNKIYLEISLTKYKKIGSIRIFSSFLS